MESDEEDEDNMDLPDDNEDDGDDDDGDDESGETDSELYVADATEKPQSDPGIASDVILQTLLTRTLTL